MIGCRWRKGNCLHLGHGKLPLVGEGKCLSLFDTGNLGLVEGESWVNSHGGHLLLLGSVPGGGSGNLGDEVVEPEDGPLLVDQVLAGDDGRCSWCDGLSAEWVVGAGGGVDTSGPLGSG